MPDRYGIDWTEDTEAGYMVASIDGEPVGHCTRDEDSGSWTACLDGQMPYTDLGEFREAARAKRAVSQSVRQFQTQ